MRLALLLAITTACGKRAEEPAPSPPPPAPVDAAPSRPAPIRATTGPVELPDDDGVGAGALTLAEYDKQYRPIEGIVAATVWPDKLTPAARAGINVIVGGKNVTWVVDRDATGWWLAYDADADGDLREEKRLRFADKKGVPELVLAVPGDVRRLRIRGDRIVAQSATIRRGTIVVDGKRLAFALVGRGGTFGEPSQTLALDLDGDGTLDLERLDGPELIHMFEKVVRIGDRGYTIHVDGDGAVLELVPTDRPPPPRPALVENTPAPPFEAHTRDGTDFAFAKLRGRVALLDFWARSCKPCLEAMPRLHALADQHRELAIVGIAPADSSDATGLALTGTQLVDPGDAIQSLYRVDRWPTYFLVDRAGKIACARCSLDDITRLIPTLLR